MPQCAVLLRSLAVSIASALLAATVDAPQQPVFRVQSRTVAVYATVRGPDGRLVTTLGKDDFQIFDNGRPAELAVFSNEVQPITVVAMLDTSYSMGGEIPRVKRAAVPFIDALFPADRATFGTFGREIAINPLLTGDKDVLKRIIREEIWTVVTSPVWTAMNAAMTSLAAEPGRRVILTLSDGEDQCVSDFMVCAKFNDTRERALAGGFMFYVIDLQGAGASSELKELAEKTGGGRFILKRDADLGRAFIDVVDELHRQYVLGFVPASLDGTTHTLEVRVTGGLKAQARKSYVAVAER